MRARILRDRYCTARCYLIWNEQPSLPGWVFWGTADTPHGESWPFRADAGRRATDQLEILIQQGWVVSDGGPAPRGSDDRGLRIERWRQSGGRAEFSLRREDGTPATILTPAIVEFGCDLPEHPGTSGLWRLESLLNRDRYQAARATPEGIAACRRGLEQLLDRAGQGFGRWLAQQPSWPEPERAAAGAIMYLKACSDQYPASAAHELFWAFHRAVHLATSQQRDAQLWQPTPRRIDLTGA